MIKILSFVALTCLACTSATGADGARGPAKDVPELQVLEHWVGIWDDDVTFKQAGLPNEMHSKGSVTAEWILNGRFVQQFATLQPDDGGPAMKTMMLMTYDPHKKVYRSWMFFASGAARELEGQWDAKSRTMTSTGRDAQTGGTTIITATFAEDGVERWTIVEKDRDAKVLAEITGTNTRRGK